jgi:hypothetical protein
MNIETMVDCEVRFVTQCDDETGWHYFLNGVEISVELVQTLKLPIQQPDEDETAAIRADRIIAAAR